MTDPSQALAPWLAPISDANPQGTDARHAPEGEAMRLQIAKLERDGVSSVSWRVVVQGADNILRKVSKDLLVCSYLTVGWCHLEGPARLPAGLELWAQLFENYADTAFPLRARARANALQWLLERIDILLTDETARKCLRPRVDDAARSLDRLSKLARQKLGDAAPAFAGVAQQIESIRGVSLEDAVSAPWQPVGEEKPPAEAPDANPELSSTGESSAASGGEVPAADSAEPAATTPDSAVSRRENECQNRIAPWLAPISEGEPCGPDLSYHDDYLALRREVVGKLEAVESTPPEWSWAVAQAGGWLAHMSKDLQVACFLTAGLWECESYNGLVVGLQLLHELATRYWETLHPLRPRRRRGHLEWLFERVSFSVSAASVTPDDLLALGDALDVLNRLSDALSPMGDEAPSTSPLRNALERQRLTAEALKTKAAPPRSSDDAAQALPTNGAAASSAPGASASTESSAPTAAAEGLGPQRSASQGNAPPPTPSGPPPVAAPQLRLPEVRDEKALYSSVASAFAQLAAMQREADLCNPMPYRLVRLAAWLTVLRPPPVTDGKMRVPAPSRSDRLALAKLHEKGGHRELVQMSERMLMRHRYWLDLTFYTAEGLRHLEGGEAAVSEVESLTSCLLARLGPRSDQAPSLQFQDGTPIASAATRAWLATLTKRADASAYHPNATGPEEPTRLGFERCLQDPLDANSLKSLTAHIEAMPRSRDRFQAHLLLAGHARRSGNLGLAQALYEALDDTVLEHRLEHWEPDLALQVLEGRLSCSTSGGVPLADVELRRLRARVARLRPDYLASISG